LLQLGPNSSTFSPDARILFVNPKWAVGKPSYLKQGDPRGRFNWIDTSMPASSIRFLAENFENTEILEYPSIEQFERRVDEGVDVVAFSFYTYQMADVERMVAIARAHRVKEVWGGGWGIDTPGARALFDRAFGGYGEQALTPVIGHRHHGPLRHPILIGEAKVLGLTTKLGYLYTIRGCKYKCVYCPTPAFIPDRLMQELGDIERVLDVYAKERVGAVIIWDETFLTDPQSWKVVEMLKERGLLWFCLTSSAELVGKVSRLRESGFVGCLIGIESLRDKTLREWRRGRLTSLNFRAIDEMHDNACWLVGSYLFCHDLDTPESMRTDVEKLESLGLQTVNPCVLTPYAPTPLFKQYESRIIDWDWRHWDDGHLVWHHEEVTPDVAREIWEDSIYTLNRTGKNISFGTRIALSRLIPFKLRSGQLNPSRIFTAARRGVRRPGVAEGVSPSRGLMSAASPTTGATPGYAPFLSR
jgi:pyruvate-formate lyase-activating enzyme